MSTCRKGNIVSRRTAVTMFVIALASAALVSTESARGQSQSEQRTVPQG